MTKIAHLQSRCAPCGYPNGPLGAHIQTKNINDLSGCVYRVYPIIKVREKNTKIPTYQPAVPAAQCHRRLEKGYTRCTRSPKPLICNTKACAPYEMGRAHGAHGQHQPIEIVELC